MDLEESRREIVPYRIHIERSQLEDLSHRLRHTRWPERETVDDWSQGIPLTYLQDVCRYWSETYRWERAEERLNSFAQFRTEIEGLGIHFLHVESPEADALPLVLTHGWPGSIVEFLKVLGPLTDPASYGGDRADAFHVVCPSLPGYGFSDKPSEPGWGVPRIARAWATIMKRLGYGRYGAQGGDWGAAVTTEIGRREVGRCIGIHLNMVPAMPTPSTMDALTDAEAEVLRDLGEHRRFGTGYSKQQSTKPQTIGYALVDSPVGQAAWILEKFWAWTDCDGHPENIFSRDELLDNVMLYWLPSAGASSARLYWESFADFGSEPVTIPTGAAIFPREIMRPSRRWAERVYTDIRHWKEYDRGGHFAAMEQPEAFVDDVRTFFRIVR